MCGYTLCAIACPHPSPYAPPAARALCTFSACLLAAAVLHLTFCMPRPPRPPAGPSTQSRLVCGCLAGLRHSAHAPPPSAPLSAPRLKSRLLLAAAVLHCDFMHPPLPIRLLTSTDVHTGYATMPTASPPAARFPPLAAAVLHCDAPHAPPPPAPAHFPPFAAVCYLLAPGLP
jgi:hypothetical protein